MIEPWRKVFREGLAPLLSDEALAAIREALAGDDPRLIQGATTTPPPLMCMQDWPVEGACLVSYAGWVGDGLLTVGEVETFFARMCFEIDNAIGEPAGCRHMLNHFDETPRDEMRAFYLAEVEREIERRLDLLLQAEDTTNYTNDL